MGTIASVKSQRMAIKDPTMPVMTAISEALPGNGNQRGCFLHLFVSALLTRRRSRRVPKDVQWLALKQADEKDNETDYSGYCERDVYYPFLDF